MAPIAFTLTTPPFPADTREMVPRSLEALYTDHATTVWRWVRRLAGTGGDVADIDDLVQEVFLQAHRSLPAFRGEALETTWLYRITARVVSRHRRARRASATREASAASDSQVPVTPEEHARGAEAEALLYRALDQLPEKQRTLLIAFELEELSGPQIADALGIKQATLWVQLHRARLALQNALEKLDAH